MDRGSPWGQYQYKAQISVSTKSQSNLLETSLEDIQTFVWVGTHEVHGVKLGNECRHALWEAGWITNDLVCRGVALAPAVV